MEIAFATVSLLRTLGVFVYGTGTYSQRCNQNHIFRQFMELSSNCVLCKHYARLPIEMCIDVRMFVWFTRLELLCYASLIWIELYIQFKIDKLLNGNLIEFWVLTMPFSPCTVL